MSAQGPVDMPPPREAMPQPQAEGEDSVLSLEERKARRQRQQARAAGGAAPAAPAGPVAAPAAGPRPVADPDTSGDGGGAPLPMAVPGPGRGPGRGPGGGGPRRAGGPGDGPRPAAEPAAVPAAAPAPIPIAQSAGPARARTRHWAVLVSFVLLVMVPTAVTAWYLWERAAPRYASTVGFSVRTEDSGSAMELLGGMMALGGGGSSSSDTDILYRFIQSQEIVRSVDERLDLRALWSKGDPDVDPVFAYHPPGTIEDLHDHWMRMVSVYNDTGTGLLDVQVQAFTPEDARAIAQAIYEESQTLINRLSDIAQEDTMRLAREELDESVERLKVARAAMTQFRNETQIVDPATSLQSQMGLLSQLEQQLAQGLIELDLLRQSTSGDDPRVQQAEARVEVIEARMDEERAKLGLGRPGAGTGAEVDPDAPPGLAPEGTAFADLVGEYESLAVDLEFGQRSYVAALASYDGALAESRQQTRYLAAHVEPTLAERADYPRRWTLTLLTGFFAALAWAMLTLGAYALRDRR